jgi:hypothetical protein
MLERTLKLGTFRPARIRMTKEHGHVAIMHGKKRKKPIGLLSDVVNVWKSVSVQPQLAQQPVRLVISQLVKMVFSQPVKMTISEPIKTFAP